MTESKHAASYPNKFFPDLAFINRKHQYYLQQVSGFARLRPSPPRGDKRKLCNFCTPVISPLFLRRAPLPSSINFLSLFIPTVIPRIGEHHTYLSSANDTAATEETIALKRWIALVLSNASGLGLIAQE